MRTFVVIPPAPVVAWEEADQHLHLDGDTDQQAEVEAMIAAATGTLDGPTGWLGRALGAQTLEARLDNFGCGSIRLPYPPMIEIVSVKYVDSAGVEQTVADGNYELLGESLVSSYGVSWATPRNQREAVRIRYRAGYEATLPAQIRAAILLMVGDLYANRATAGPTQFGAVPMSTTVENLLAPLRVWA
ncbi:head-tail connector protein [Sphingomonas immobilis]|uniref:Head-tail connector protein n=1 Tax=Sphingomonas immobilis TaxID=3063997 RepID=A0ABT8ZUZ1_9SPHN|nr:head-tail connector protein [Sphingomonas sp. CA1-15]MDO7841083.1 head-tail connector protein [Sphingomonas sp. CA1-15]